MNKKIFFIIIALVLLAGLVVLFFVMRAKNQEIKSAGSSNFVQVKDPVKEILSKPQEDTADRPVAISGQINSTKVVNGLLYLGDNKIEVKDSKFELEQMPKGVFEAEFVDQDNNYYILEPGLVQIFAPQEINFDIAN